MRSSTTWSWRRGVAATATALALAAMSGCGEGEIGGPGAAGDEPVAGKADGVAGTVVAASQAGEVDYFVPPLEPQDPSQPPIVFATLPGPLTVFVNLAGQKIKRGPWAPDNAQTNTSFIPRADSVAIPRFEHAPYGSDRAQVVDSLLATLRADYKGFKVTFTNSRPQSGPYTMIVVGGRPKVVGATQTTLGVAPLDEGNINQGDVGFVFSAHVAASGYTLKQLAQVIAHELGHTLGLKHVDRQADIMSPAACHCATGWGVGNLSGPEPGRQDDLQVLWSVLPPKADAPNTCYARCCNGVLKHSITRSDAGCADQHLCQENKHTLRLRRGGKVVWERAGGC